MEESHSVESRQQIAVTLFLALKKCGFGKPELVVCYIWYALVQNKEAKL